MVVKPTNNNMPMSNPFFEPPAKVPSRLPRRYLVFLCVVPILALSWLGLTLLNPDAGRGGLEALSLGFFFGSLFGHATLAAAWAAFGPGKLLWRVPLSLVWLLLVAVGVQINVTVNGGPPNGAFLVAACMLGQWLLLQLPLWGLALGLRMRLRHSDEIEQARDPRHWQFGIRQLLIVTAIVGVMFGIGRLVLMAIGDRFQLSGGDGPILMFLALAAIPLNLPLLLGGLMRRWTVPGVVLALALIAGATLLELALLQRGMRRPSLEWFNLAVTNGVSAAIVLAIVAVVRFNGYSLARTVKSNSKALAA